MEISWIWLLVLLAVPKGQQKELAEPSLLPSAPQHLRPSLISSRSIRLSWRPPSEPRGNLLHYTVLYSREGAAREKSLNTSQLGISVENLEPENFYKFRIFASNKFGAGEISPMLKISTLPEAQFSSPVENFRAFSSSPGSIQTLWDPPEFPEDFQKFRLFYRETESGIEKSVESVDVAGNSFLLQGLKNFQEYRLRLVGYKRNGEGLETAEIGIKTVPDESQVPEQPSSLQLHPLPSGISLSWGPPLNPKIFIRGFLISYGLGSPYAHTVTLDRQQNSYKILNLEPNSHYVVSLKAFNNAGEGIPLYGSATTKAAALPSPPSPPPSPPPLFAPPLPPPIALHVFPLGPSSIRLSWADPSEPQNPPKIPQKSPQNPPKIPPKSQPRFYTVRWRSSSGPNGKFKSLDTTALTLSVPGLRPHTSYEFSVMATRGRRSSTWSMTAHATTHETAPSSPPKDVTVISREGKFRNAVLSWQPPVEANGKITGYTIFYSPIKSAPISEWIPQAVGAERLSQPIPEALLDSGSFFRVQARNSKGPGPLSESIYYRSPKEAPIGAKSPNSDPGALLLILGISGGVSVVAAAVGAWICSRKHQERKKKNQGKRNLNQKEPRPPDLWIHHEEMELKNVEKNVENSQPTAPNPPKIPNEPKNSEVEPGNPNVPQPVPEPELGASTLERSGIARRGKLNAAVVSGIPVPNLESPFPNFPLRPLPFPSLANKILAESEAGNSEEIPSRTIPTACVRPTHPLRSFGNSLPPQISYNSILQQAPFKPLLPAAPEASEDPKNSPVYEQDELSEQMASLEGLMKQLNAIF